MYSAMEVARYIISEEYLSAMKLQSVLYFCQAHFIAFKKRQLFEEPIEPVGFGVVITNVFQKYIVYGGAGIPNMWKDEPISIREEDKREIRTVIGQAHDYSPQYLADLIKGQEPWIRAREQKRAISCWDLADYFRED